MWITPHVSSLIDLPVSIIDLFTFSLIILQLRRVTFVEPEVRHVVVTDTNLNIYLAATRTHLIHMYEVPSSRSF